MRKLALTLAALAAMLALAACQCRRPIKTCQRPAAASPVHAEPTVAPPRCADPAPAQPSGSPDGTPAPSSQPKTCPPEG